MIINIASFGGRTHMLDTARELEKFGHTVRFYSYVRDKRAMHYGLKKECNKSIFFFAFPFLIIFKIFGWRLWREDLYNYCCDWFLSFYMKPCDVFIGQSPMHLHAIKAAKKRFGALTILERGISHVNFQNNVLKRIDPNRTFMTDYHIKRDLKGYMYPDYISVGSEHVKETFVDEGYPAYKIFVNNYGANLNFFMPTELSDTDTYDILLVGQWCKRKGCELIIKAVQQLDIRLLHVGSIVDVAFPQDDSRFTHFDAVIESKLIDFYRQARVFVMPSYDEGLSLVQAQALVCGLPLVCSKFSGGRDLRKALIDEKYIIEMDSLNVESLISSIQKALLIAKKQVGIRNIMNEEDNLSFEAYGKRYNAFLHKALTNKMLSKKS